MSISLYKRKNMMSLFKDLSYGSIFIWDEKICIKVESINEFNCVILDTGKPYKVPENYAVDVLEMVFLKG